VTPDAERRKKPLLVAVLVCELFGAYWLRWPLTRATLETNFDYLLGQEVVASENWRREGALARHFIPSRSIDQALPEWSDRDIHWRDYLSQPPLSFMLEYWASLAFSRVDPVIVGKLLAQVLTAAAILGSAGLLCDVFGAGPTLLGLSFLIWGEPFLVWFIDGYYATTPAMLFQLLLSAWCLAFLQRVLAAEGPSTLRWREMVAPSTLAFLGAFSEWVALFGNVVAASLCVVLGTVFLIGRSSRAKHVYGAAVAIAAGSVMAVASTAVLFGSKLGYQFYWGALMDRVEARESAGVTGSYSDVLVRQMQTAWPRHLLVVMCACCVVVVVWAVFRLWKDGLTPGRADGALMLSAVVIGFGSGVPYTIRLKNLVTIHWWFIGTWALGWMMTLCAFAYIVRRSMRPAGGGQFARTGYTAFCAVAVAGVVASNLSFVDLHPPESRRLRDLYRVLGRVLPADGRPFIVADIPESFRDYPFATAYLRRPIVEYQGSGALVKPGTTEDARADLQTHGPVAHVAYDRSVRHCVHEDETPAWWRFAATLALCRVPMMDLIQNPPHVFEAIDPDSQLSRWLGVVTGDGCCGDTRRLLAATRLVYARLLARSSEAVARARNENASTLRELVEGWHRASGGVTAARVPEWGSTQLVGVLADEEAWSLVLANVDGATVPDTGVDMHVKIGSMEAPLVRAFRTTTRDGKTALPLVVIDVRPPRDGPERDLVVELYRGDVPVLRASGVSMAHVSGGSTDPETSRALAALDACGAPDALRVVANRDRTVTLQWEMPAVRARLPFVVEAGSRPGLSDVTTIQRAEQYVTATDVKPGTYFVRARAETPCGLSAASNEVIVVVQ
jgi:hypothetical protein